MLSGFNLPCKYNFATFCSLFAPSARSRRVNHRVVQFRLNYCLFSLFKLVCRDILRPINTIDLNFKDQLKVSKYYRRCLQNLAVEFRKSLRVNVAIV